ncbi:MAG: hypothetical protein R8F63_20275 [Acidimicrobiales bacterium]|nr:hypothetical protein [Acidimicrobiales bacterium]GJM36939.1 MAG: hypothetical protein DHS20C19_03060 [Acidimicrobiales bacterium]
MSDQIEAAYYYPAPYWHPDESGWIKTLLLFFDEIDILLPGYMYGRHHVADPSMAIPLEELGLLRVLEPKTWVTGDIALKLAEVMVELLTAGVFDDLPETQHFAELSQSRIGYGADVELADMLVEELEARALARPSEDGVSIPLHPVVRTTILVLLGQLARLASASQNVVMNPTTGHGAAVADLVALLSREPLPSAHSVVSLDLEPVTFDLDPVPLDEVLEFRASHGPEHKTYMRDLRRFLAELCTVPEKGDRMQLLLERRQELADNAHDLQRSSRAALGRNLSSWSLGLAGAAWSAASGDPIGMALGTAGLVVPQVVGAALPEPQPVAAYSYLFSAQRQFAR